MSKETEQLTVRSSELNSNTGDYDISFHEWPFGLSISWKHNLTIGQKYYVTFEVRKVIDISKAN